MRPPRPRSLWLALLVCAACNDQNPHDPPDSSNPHEPGRAEVAIELGPIGVLARAESMEPVSIAILLISDAADTILDSASLSIGSSLEREYSLSSHRIWSIAVRSRDENDSIIHTGTARFSVLPNQTSRVELRVDARYSRMHVEFPPNQGLRRFYLAVDGIVRGDTTVTSETSDTVSLDAEYLTASTGSGTPHRISIKAFATDGTPSYALDTTIRSISGEDQNLALILPWVGEGTPPDGHPRLFLQLGNVGQIGATILYQDPTSTFGSAVDTRDGLAYRTRTFSGNTWYLENVGSTCGGCDSAGTRFRDETISGACPSGWHIPDTLEWNALFKYVSPSATTAQALFVLKSVSGWRHWALPSEWTDNGNDLYGFRLLPTFSYNYIRGSLTRPADIGGTGANMWTSTPGVRFLVVAPAMIGYSESGFRDPISGGVEDEGGARCVKN